MNDLDPVLRGLKDFQRRTVDYVFERMYGPDATTRFLVADEVGLGKTLVARGVIARAIEHLRPTVPRIDVVYVCSNGDIARQNVNRLKTSDDEHMVLASRLTMLPLKVRRLRETKTGINFISFTPATSFDLKSGLGRAEERVLLYWMLRDAWDLGDAAAPKNVLQGQAGTDSFRSQIQYFDPARIDAQSKKDFAERLRRHKALRREFDDLCSEFSTANRSISGEVSARRTRLVGELRAVLAASCVDALEPNLVILDEFQRFSHLLDGDDDASLLAREMFNYDKVRVLLLSATPYKMYTETDDPLGEDHYRDFLRTVAFLENRGTATPIEPLLRDYREALYALGDPGGAERLMAARATLEKRLRRVMVRTERLASTPDRDGMLVEVPAAVGDLRTSDVHDYKALQEVARVVEHNDTIEYWKSAPYALSFMGDNYKLKRDLLVRLEQADGRAAIARALAKSTCCTLPWSAVERYGEIDPGNARLRGLVSEVVGNGAWRLLWVPPSFPYYRLGGPFAAPELARFTKRLVFSSWVVVPRVIAGILSYEAERRMFAGDPEAENTPEARKKRRRQLLRFGKSDGRLTGMPVFALLYPSLFLARACDPVRLAAEHARDGGAGELLSVDDVMQDAKDRIDVALRRLGADDVTGGPPDERWYWAAPLLLDRLLEPRATQDWFAQADLAQRWSGATDEDDDASASDDDRDHWGDHVAEACRVATSTAATIGGEPLGRRPDDLVEVLAQLAIAGPAVTMLRAFDRVIGGEGALAGATRVELRNAAGRTAWAFRSLFNQPEVVTMLRRNDQPYWRSVLQYCVEGCLPAVLDEYVHVLRDHLGLLSGKLEGKLVEIADGIAEALELRTSRIGVDDVARSEAGRTAFAKKKNLRTHFALRFGDEPNEDGTVVTRADQVRKAFNSPFWPFVVATTSVGQEGLDFHAYCHAVVHWNLPSNPVDLEQREGRVHRYKNHAVRKNIAQAHGWAALEGDERDPWEASFALAHAQRPADATDIVPYWVYPTEGGARIERHVPALPLSREREQICRLSQSLALYRMVFGQPRQEDLVRHLAQHGAVTADAWVAAGAIKLSPE
jgi:hypothetical protein